MCVCFHVFVSVYVCMYACMYVHVCMYNLSSQRSEASVDGGEPQGRYWD